MYITRVPNRGSPPAVLLRESFRENGKVKTRTLANLSLRMGEASGLRRNGRPGFSGRGNLSVPPATLCRERSREQA
jgi:hypothetical protein